MLSVGASRVLVSTQTPHPIFATEAAADHFLLKLGSGAWLLLQI
jgi:hypothetical protein